MQLPPYVSQLFWGDDLSKLDMQKHFEYFVTKILEIGDLNATKWLFSNTNKSDLKAVLPKLKLSPKSANYWSLYFNHNL